MAKITTLVKDIQDLMASGFDVTTDIQKFSDRLASHLSKRASETKGEPSLRMSNLGTHCNRKLWYAINHPEWGEGLSPDARIKFLFGDLVEELLLFLAQEAGHTVSRQQEEVEIDGVKGHIDGFIDDHLVDCKSASSFSFQKFKAHQLANDDPFGYITQLGSYCFALGERSASFLVIDKTLGHICLDTHAFPGDRDYKALIALKRSQITQPQEPPRGYHDEAETKYRRVTGNRKLGVNCSYCDFKFRCWPNLVLEIGAKPTFYTHKIGD